MWVIERSAGRLPFSRARERRDVPLFGLPLVRTYLRKNSVTGALVGVGVGAGALLKLRQNGAGAAAHKLKTFIDWGLG